MAVVKKVGVIDNDSALATPVERSCDLSVKYLFQEKQQHQRERETAKSTVEGEYANALDIYDRTPLLLEGCFGICSPSRRIIRMLFDAGADTTSVLRVTHKEGNMMFSATPLSPTVRFVRRESITKMTPQGSTYTSWRPSAA